mgnify:FL=1
MASIADDGNDQYEFDTSTFSHRCFYEQTTI